MTSYSSDALASAAEALLLALLYKGRSVQQLHQRQEWFQAVRKALQLPEVDLQQALCSVQERSRQALLHITSQLQELHAKLAVDPSSHAAPHPAEQCTTVYSLTAGDFCSEVGYDSWVQLHWQHQQALLLQLQQLPQFYGELQVQVQHAVLEAPEQPLSCFSCICSQAPEALNYSPYCVVWLKNNWTSTARSAPVNSRASTSCSCSSNNIQGPLALLHPACHSQQYQPSGAGGSIAACTTAQCADAQRLQEGTQTQHTAVIEGCNCPLWCEQLSPYHIANQDAVLRLQVRSSQSSGATLDWFRQSSGLSSTHSRITTLSDYCIGQASVGLSALQQALQEATVHSCDDKSQLQQQQQPLVLPLYGPLKGSTKNGGSGSGQPGSPLTAVSRHSSNHSFGLSSKHCKADGHSMQQHSLPDFLADAAQHEQQLAASCQAASAVAQCKAPLAVPHTASAVSQGLQQLVLYDPVRGTSSGIQGREVVGKVHLLLSYHVEEQMVPAADLAGLSLMSLESVLTSLPAQGQSVPLPQPLCAAKHTASGHIKSSDYAGPAEEQTTSTAGQAALEAAVSLVSAVWKLWKVGGLADVAEDYQAQLQVATASATAAQAAPANNCGRSKSAFTASAGPGGVGGSRAAAAGALEGHHSQCGMTSQGSGADWTLGTCHSNAGSAAVSDAFADRLSFLQSEYGLSQTGSGILSQSSLQSSVCSDRYSSTAGGFRTQPHQASRLQQVTHNTVDDRLAPNSHQQQQQQEGQQQLQGLPRQHAGVGQHSKPSIQSPEAAALMMQLLSLHRLAGAAGRAEPDVENVLPGVFYLHWLSDGAVLSGVRPAAVRLALLQQVLQSWLPDQPHLQALVNLISPLMIADRQQLLTWSESAMLQDIAESLLNTVQQLFSCHCNLYPEQSQAAACVPLLLALLASLLGCQSQQQLVEAASPLLARAAKRQFMQVIEPDAASAANAAVTDILERLLGNSAAADQGHGPTAGQLSGRVVVQVSKAEGDPAGSNVDAPASSSYPHQTLGLLELFRFRDNQRTAGGADSQAGDNQRMSSSSGLFSSLIETLQQRHSHASDNNIGQASLGGSKPGFWRKAEVQGQQGTHKGPPGPVGEGLLRAESDEALEAACRAMDMEGVGTKVSSTAGAAADGSTAVAGLFAWSRKTGGVVVGQQQAAVEPAGQGSCTAASGTASCISVNEHSQPSAASVGKTAESDSKLSAAAAADNEVPVVTDFVIHTRLEYDTTDSTSSSISSPLSAALFRRRTTAGVLMSDSEVPRIAEGSSSNHLNDTSSPMLQTSGRSRHTRFGSVGAIDSLFSRLGRITRDEVHVQHPSSTAEYARSQNAVLAEQPIPATAAEAARLLPVGQGTAAGKLTVAPGDLGSYSHSNKLMGNIGRHGRSGSAGSLDLWISHKSAFHRQQQQPVVNIGSSRHVDDDRKGPSPAAAVETGSGDAAAQDDDWDREVINLTTAVGVVMEVLERDINMQGHLPPQLQLPLIGIHVRYSLVNSQLQSLLASAHEVPYDSSLRKLEAAVRQLHGELLQQGWAVDSGVPGQDAGLPGNLPLVALCNLNELMAPVWKAWLKESGQHLLSLVDNLITAQAAVGGHSNSAWAPVAAEQQALYSSSVVDLFQLLQGLTDQVLEQVVMPVDSLTHKAASISTLAGILEAAVGRYVAHLHAAAVGLLRAGQVVVAPGSAVQSGKVIRHRRGQSVGSSPVSRVDSSTLPQWPSKHTRAASALPAGAVSPLSQVSAGPTGGSTSSNSSPTSKTGFLTTSMLSRGGSGLSNTGGNTAAADYCVGSSSSSSLGGVSGAALTASSMQQQPSVVTSGLCVVLNSLQEVLLKQQQLWQQIMGELEVHIGGGVATLAGAAANIPCQHSNNLGESNMTTSPRAACALQPYLLPTAPEIQVQEDSRLGSLPQQGTLQNPTVGSNDHGSVVTGCVAGDDDDVENDDDDVDDDDDNDDDDTGSDSDISVMTFTDGEEDPVEQQQQQQQMTQLSADSIVVQQHQLRCEESLPLAVPTAHQHSQLPQPIADSPTCMQNQPALDNSQVRQVPQQDVNQEIIKQLAQLRQQQAGLSARVISVLNELLQVTMVQLQPRMLSLLAGLLAVLTASEAAAADVTSVPAQLMLAPLFVELASLQQLCCPDICHKLLLVQWEAVAAAVSQLALCQVSKAAAGAAAFAIPQPLQGHHVTLLQRLLILLQSEVSDAVVANLDRLTAAGETNTCGSSSKSANSSSTAAAVAGVAAAAVHARALLQLLQQPTADVIQKFLDSCGSSQQLQRASSDGQQLSRNSGWQKVGSISNRAFGQQVLQLDILRCLRQRAHDPEAQLFVQMQLRKAGTDAMRLLFGLSQHETVRVYAACTTSAAVLAVAESGGNSSDAAGLLSGLSSGNSSSGLAAGYSTATGCFYLSQGYLAFTNLTSDMHAGEDDAAFAKRVKQQHSNQKVPDVGKQAQQAMGARIAAAAATAAAAGTTGSSSTGLSSKSWWKGVMPSAGSSSGSNSTALTSSTAAVNPGSDITADTTLLIPLATVARLDKVFHKAQDALLVTMLDRSSRVFYDFESVGVRDRLFDEVRLAVMGSNSALDRSLRCMEPTPAALALGLPAEERLIRTHQCLKYGPVRNKPGNLYICSSLLTFDYDDTETSKPPTAAPTVVTRASAGSYTGPSPASAGVTESFSNSSATTAAAGREHSCGAVGSSAAGQLDSTDVMLAIGSRVLVRYQDVSKLKQEKARMGDRYWVSISYTAANGEAGRLEIGGVGQAQAAEIIADIEQALAAM